MAKRLVGAAAMAALVALTTACGGNSGASSSSSSASTAGAGTVQVDVGTTTPIALPAGKLRVGWFTSGSTNEWLQVLTNEFKKKGAEFGWDVKVYDPGWDPAKQLNQIQNAIQNHEVDAAIVLPIDGGLACKAMSEQLPAANILTVVVTVPPCGNETKTGNDSWVPGILSFVGSIDNAPYSKAWFEAAAKQFTGPQEVAIIEGPAIGGQAKAVNGALAQFQADNPGAQFNVKQVVETDYTTATGLAKTKALLAANPNISVIMSVYSPDLTRGVLQAVKEAGKQGKIGIADMGASQWTLDQMSQGNIAMTMPNKPLNIMDYAAGAIKSAQSGEKVAHFIDDQLPDRPYDNPLVITKQNMADYKPQF